MFSKGVEGEGIVTSQSANVRKREKKVGVGGEEKGCLGPIGWVNLLLFNPTSHPGFVIKRLFVRGRESQFKGDLFSLQQQEEKSSGHISLRDGRTDADGARPSFHR